MTDFLQNLARRTAPVTDVRPRLRSRFESQDDVAVESTEQPSNDVMSSQSESMPTQPRPTVVERIERHIQQTSVSQQPTSSESRRPGVTEPPMSQQAVHPKPMARMRPESPDPDNTLQPKRRLKHISKRETVTPAANKQTTEVAPQSPQPEQRVPQLNVQQPQLTPDANLETRLEKLRDAVAGLQDSPRQVPLLPPAPEALPKVTKEIASAPVEHQSADTPQVNVESDHDRDGGQLSAASLTATVLEQLRAETLPKPLPTVVKEIASAPVEHQAADTPQVNVESNHDRDGGQLSAASLTATVLEQLRAELTSKRQTEPKTQSTVQPHPPPRVVHVEQAPSARLAEPPQKTVNVSIGRVEIKANSSVKPQAATAVATSTLSRVMSLDDYIARRSSGGIA